jgi:pyroglutamyl-peptidase
MPSRRPIVLLTGFGPFPGVPVNASADLAAELASRGARAFPGYRIVAAELPTEWERAPATAALLYEGLRPAVALHFGVSRRARGFEIETRGRNVTCQSADATGILPSAARLAPEGPEVVASAIPVARIMVRLRRLGLPVSISRDAGRYLCNAVLFHGLVHRSATGEAPITGFIHIPEGLAGMRPGRPRPARGTRMAWPDAVTGGLEILGTCLGRPPLLRR